MKTIAVLLLIFTCFSCHKEKFRGNSGIIGKWKLTETYSTLGVYNPGWTAVPANYSKQIQFFADGTFEENNLLMEIARHCSGTFTLVGDSLLVKQSSCHTNVDTFHIEALNNMQLILKWYVSGIVDREKYSAVE